jgi:hypothetical protein
MASCDRNRNLTSGTGPGTDLLDRQARDDPSLGTTTAPGSIGSSAGRKLLPRTGSLPQGARDSSRVRSLRRALARLRTFDSVEALRRHGVVEAYRLGEYSSATLWMLDTASPGGAWEVLCDAGIEGSFRRRRSRQIRRMMASIVLDDPEAVAGLRASNVLVLHEPAGGDAPAGGDERWPVNAFALVDVDRDLISVMQVVLSDTSPSADIDVLCEAIRLFAEEWGHMLRAARTIAQLRVRLQRTLAVIEAIGDPSDPDLVDVLELITLLTDAGGSAIAGRAGA